MRKGLLIVIAGLALMFQGCVVQFPGFSGALIASYMKTESKHTDGTYSVSEGGATVLTNLDVTAMAASVEYKGVDEDGNPLEESIKTGAGAVRIDNDKLALKLAEVAEALGSKVIDLESGALTLKAAAEAAAVALEAFQKNDENSMTADDLAAIRLLIKNANLRADAEPEPPSAQ